MQMNQEVKKLWLEALRSGEYEQGTKVLKTKDGKYCCLGVLCEVFRKTTGRGSWYVDGFVLGHELRGGYLVPQVMIWAGISSEEGIYESSQADKQSLALDNDNGKTFEEIAQIIEEKF